MPSFLTEINPKTCIGCGRCYKVCPQSVMHLYGVDADDQVLGIVTEDDDDDFDGELNRKVMMVDHSGSCIGCSACSKGCPKDSQTHVAADALAD
jgi:Nif-specific ferredoxin III